MEAGPPQDSFAQQVPIERFQVSHVKNDAMSFGNWPLVEELGLDLFEQSVGFGARLPQTGKEFVLDFESVLRSEHCGTSRFWQGHSAPARW
jgi:hypothetical protein